MPTPVSGPGWGNHGPKTKLEQLGFENLHRAFAGSIFKGHQPHLLNKEHIDLSTMIPDKPESRLAGVGIYRNDLNVIPGAFAWEAFRRIESKPPSESKWLDPKRAVPSPSLLIGLSHIVCAKTCLLATCSGTLETS
jgi:hypothetical protein